MKKIIALTGFVALMSLSSHAQDTTSVKDDIKKGAKKVGHKTAEIASKGKSKITDERYKDKVGPNGETIYIDNHSKYYWVDKSGHRHYAAEADLKSKN